MNSTGKIVAALVAIVVVGGGLYALLGTSSSDVAIVPAQTSHATPAPESAAMATAPTSPTAASDSFEDFSAAMQGDAHAQEVATQSTNAAADQAVSSSNTVTSSSEPYDPSTI